MFSARLFKLVIHFDKEFALFPGGLEMLSALVGGGEWVVARWLATCHAFHAGGRAKFCTLNGDPPLPTHFPALAQVFNQIRILCNLSEFLCSGSPRPQKLRNLTLSFVVLFHFISVRFASLMATFCHYTLRKNFTLFSYYL